MCIYNQLISEVKLNVNVKSKDYYKWLICMNLNSRDNKSQPQPPLVSVLSSVVLHP